MSNLRMACCTKDSDSLADRAAQRDVVQQELRDPIGGRVEIVLHPRKIGNVDGTEIALTCERRFVHLRALP